MPETDAASTGVHYRQAQESDLVEVAEMYAKMSALMREFTFNFPEVENVGTLWVDTFRRTLGRFSVVFLAEYEGQRVGFILARIKRVPPYLGSVTVGELSDMWVEPAVRRLGIGEKLLRLAIEWLREQGAYSLEAQILVGNEPILRLVQSLGLKPELYQMRLKWEDYSS